MPRGFEAIEECQLHQRSRVLDSELCDRLAAWWLPKDQLSDRTPNFDIAANCLVEGRPGMLLVEAKAYDKELIRESGGRKVKSSNPKEQSLRDSSHKTIGAAIDEALSGLSVQTGLNFGISRDTCYQLSNRFAWAWKLADSGLPVVLIYLGFLNAEDMARDGQPFRNHDDWERLVRSHSAKVVPEAIWNQKWTVNGRPFFPIIRSISQPLENKLEQTELTRVVRTV